MPVIQVGPNTMVGFDDVRGLPIAQSKEGPAPSAGEARRLAHAAREELLLGVSLLTQWLKATEGPRPELVVPDKRLVIPR